MEKEKGENAAELLYIMHPREKRELADYVYDVIKHGDDEHKRWLREKIDEIFQVT